MFPKRESLDVEFKSDSKNLDDVIIVEEVVALANTHGGHLYIGIEDDGTVTGAKPNHLKTYRIAALVANRTVPSLTVTCEDIDGVLVINVPKSTSVIATAKGRILKRRLKADGSPKSAPMYPFELSTRLSDLGKLDFTAQPIPEATMEDFDELELQRIKNLINNQHGSDKYLLELSDEDLLKTLRMAVDFNGEAIPTVCGLVLAGKQSSIEKYVPTAKASLQVLEGTNIRINQDFSGGLLNTIEQIRTGIAAWNPITELEYGLIREPVHLYNENSVREALVNAFGHRDYSVLKRVIVKLDDMGMTISSPGSFIEGVTIKNLLTVEPHGRNPALMDALKRIGLAERTGRGIDRIYEGSLLYGRPIPDYSESDDYKVSVYFAAVQADADFCKMLADVRERTQKPFPITSLLVLSLIKQYRRLEMHDFATYTSLNKSILHQTIESLIESGLVENIGTRSSGVYILSAHVYKTAGKEKEYVRQTGIQKVRRPEMILNLLQQAGTITVSDVSQLLQINKQSAYYEIKKLVHEGKIQSAKRGRDAYYVAVSK